jgi:DNA polymerase elongation subunit (family B)
MSRQGRNRQEITTTRKDIGIIVIWRRGDRWDWPLILAAVSSTDSVFLKKSGATFDDFVSVKDILARETGLPITLETCYKFLVLLPPEADEKLEALKHYYGITHTPELVVWGIEARRHDAPTFTKDFQSELLYTLFDCKDSHEIMSRAHDNALLLVTKTIDKVMTGEPWTEGLDSVKDSETGFV